LQSPHLGCRMNRSAQSCGSDPHCNWTKRGCIRRRGVKAGQAYLGPLGPP
jgi:hypothetical protein